MEEKLKYEDSFVICDKHLGNYLGVYKNENCNKNITFKTDNIRKAKLFTYRNARKYSKDNNKIDLKKVSPFEIEYVSPTYQIHSLISSFVSLIIGIVMFTFIFFFLNPISKNWQEILKFIFPIIFAMALHITTQLIHKLYKLKANKIKKRSFISLEREFSLLEIQSSILFLFINITFVFLFIYVHLTKDPFVIYYCITVFLLVMLVTYISFKTQGKYINFSDCYLTEENLNITSGTIHVNKKNIIKKIVISEKSKYNPDLFDNLISLIEASSYNKKSIIPLKPITIDSENFQKLILTFLKYSNGVKVKYFIQNKDLDFE